MRQQRTEQLVESRLFFRCHGAHRRQSQLRRLTRSTGSIRLDKCDCRTALGVKLHVERLIEAKRTAMPLHAETALWLRQINQRIARSDRPGRTV